MKGTLRISVPLLVLLMLPGSELRADSQNDILVVVNNSLNVESISKDELKAIFLKKKTVWSTGDKAIPIHAKDSRLKDQFLRRVLDLNSNAEAVYWQEEKIKNGLTPPPELDQTLKAVFKLKGAVSYIYRSQYREQAAKIVLVVPE